MADTIITPELQEKLDALQGLKWQQLKPLAAEVGIAEKPFPDDEWEAESNVMAIAQAQLAAEQEASEPSTELEPIEPDPVADPGEAPDVDPESVDEPQEEPAEEPAPEPDPEPSDPTSSPEPAGEYATGYYVAAGIDHCPRCGEKRRVDSLQRPFCPRAYPDCTYASATNPN